MRGARTTIGVTLLERGLLGSWVMYADEPAGPSQRLIFRSRVSSVRTKEIDAASPRRTAGGLYASTVRPRRHHRLPAHQACGAPWSLLGER
jgi:hypothetical protein